MNPPDVCPNCGAEVPRKAKACPGCGSDEKTGWAEDAYVSSLDLPDDEFDYDKFVENEFGTKPARKSKPSIAWLWWVVAVALVAIILLTWVLK